MEADQVSRDHAPTGADAHGTTCFEGNAPTHALYNLAAHADALAHQLYAIEEQGSTERDREAAHWAQRNATAMRERAADLASAMADCQLTTTRQALAGRLRELLRADPVNVSGGAA